MRREIPAPIIAVCAEATASFESHAGLDNLFSYAGAPGDPPLGSKRAKALAWLRRCNKDSSVEDPLKIAGRILEPFMEGPLDPSWDESKIALRERITATLAECQLQYVRGGIIASALGTPTRTLAQFIRDRDFSAIDQEFKRATENSDTDPREAVSAAANILESVCKVYIEDEGLDAPTKQDLQGVWNVVRKHLGFDPARVEDQDLQQILSGMLSTVHGVGSLRTHASSAHGAGRKGYRLEPRHARLAIHASHTVALFVLESWQRKNQ